MTDDNFHRIAAQATRYWDRLPMWVIFDHPDDWPDFYVARLHYSLPEPAPSDLMMLCKTLEPLRQAMEDQGFTRLDRSPEDPPNLLETWLA